MAAWTFALCDHLGAEQAILDDAYARSLRFVKNRAAEVAFALDLEDGAAVTLMEILRNSGLPRLKCYGDGELRFYGHWAPSRLEGGADDQQAMSLLFRDPFARYEDREFGPGSYASTDAGAIAWDLIDAVNALDVAAGVPRGGLAAGAIGATVARDRTYDAGKLVGEAVRQLTEVEGGFDFSVTPEESLGADVLGTFGVFASLGSDRSATAIFEHGPRTLANVLHVGQSIGLPRNASFVSGDDGASARAADAASQVKYGVICAPPSRASDGTTETSTLQEIADGLIRANPIEVVDFTADPAHAPRPWLDYWLGDTVRFRAERGALSALLTPRVTGVEIRLDDEGNESEHVLTFDTGEAA